MATKDLNGECKNDFRGTNGTYKCASSITDQTTPREYETKGQFDLV